MQHSNDQQWQSKALLLCGIISAILFPPISPWFLFGAMAMEAHNEDAISSVFALSLCLVAPFLIFVLTCMFYIPGVVAAILLCVYVYKNFASLTFGGHALDKV